MVARCSPTHQRMKNVPHNGAIFIPSKRFRPLFSYASKFFVRTTRICTKSLCNASVKGLIRLAIIVSFNQCLIRFQIAKSECLRMIRHRVFQLVARRSDIYGLTKNSIISRIPTDMMS